MIFTDTARIIDLTSVNTIFCSAFFTRTKQMFLNHHSSPFLHSQSLIPAESSPFPIFFRSQGNLDLRLAEAINPHHPEVLFFNDRIHIESEKLFKLSLKAFSDQCYPKAVTLLRHAISLSPLDVKLHITEAKVHRMAGDLEEALKVIQSAASLYERAAFTDCTAPNTDTDMNTSTYTNTSTNSCTSNSVNGYSRSGQRRELPDDILLQKSLIINDMAIASAVKGDYIRAIALLNRIIIDPLKGHGHKPLLARTVTSYNDNIKNKFEEVNLK